MFREALFENAVQSTLLFFVLWILFRTIPTVPANAKAWLWRIAFLKPVVCLIPFATLAVPILPANSVMQDTVLREYSASATPNPISIESTLKVDWVVLGWWVGLILFSLYVVFSIRKTRRFMQSCEEVEDIRLISIFDGILNRAGLSRRPLLLSSPLAQTPMLVAGLRNAVILPEASLLGTDDDLRMMIAHEVAHIARRDLWWLGAIFFSQSIYFFNPAVWLASRCSRADHESATDQLAVRLAGVPIQQYADMLLRATVVARPPAVLGSSAMSDNYKNIQRRLEAMKNFNKKPTIRQRAIVVAMVAVTFTALPTYRLAAQNNSTKLTPIQGRIEKLDKNKVAKVERLHMQKPVLIDASKLAKVRKIDGSKIVKVTKIDASKVIKKMVAPKLKIAKKINTVIQSKRGQVGGEQKSEPVQYQRIAVPVLSDLPILGVLFLKEEPVKPPMLRDIPIVQGGVKSLQETKVSGETLKQDNRVGQRQPLTYRVSHQSTLAPTSRLQYRVAFASGATELQMLPLTYRLNYDVIYKAKPYEIVRTIELPRLKIDPPKMKSMEPGEGLRRSAYEIEKVTSVN